MLLWDFISQKSVHAILTLHFQFLFFNTQYSSNKSQFIEIMNKSQILKLYRELSVDIIALILINFLNSTIFIEFFSHREKFRISIRARMIQNSVKYLTRSLNKWKKHYSISRVLAPCSFLYLFIFLLNNGI